MYTNEVIYLKLVNPENRPHLRPFLARSMILYLLSVHSQHDDAFITHGSYFPLNKTCTIRKRSACSYECTHRPINVSLFSGTRNHFKALMMKLDGTLKAAVPRAMRCCCCCFFNKRLRKTCPNESLAVWGNHVLKARRNKNATS